MSFSARNISGHSFQPIKLEVTIDSQATLDYIREKIEDRGSDSIMFTHRHVHPILESIYSAAINKGN